MATRKWMSISCLWLELFAKEEKGDKASGSKSDREDSRPAKKYIAGEDEDGPPPRRKFDIKKVRCHKCGELGHFKKDCKKSLKERALIPQEGDDDGPMMLMLEVTELKDEDDPPSPVTKIVPPIG